MDFFFGANGCVTTGFVCKDVIVLIDNSQTHQPALPLLRHMLFASGIGLILLPPYRPESNPIEFMWSKVMYLIRRYGKATKDQYLDSLRRHGYDHPYGHAGVVSALWILILILILEVYIITGG
jgi:hypothetical protein